MRGESELIESISRLVEEMRCDREQRKQEQQNHAVLHRMAELEIRLNMKLSEIKAQVKEAAANNREAFTELGTKIADLEKQIADLIEANTDPDVTDAEFETALAQLGTDAKALKDIVPGSPTAPPV